MIKTKTVLILGAGASVPYKFPLGKGLVEKIYRIAQNEQLEECGFDKINILRFKESLFLSGTNSIDEFLEYRQEFIAVGKAAIAQILIPFEKEIELFERFNDATKWYDFLFEKMNSTFEDFDKNSISFITYNYDRSLEHFLFTAIKNKYGKSDEEVVEKFNKIPIIHLHGHLGLLPWQSDGRPYTPEVTESKILKSSQNIKIIHEDISDDPEFQRAHNLLKEATFIYFLGFGYNETNVKRLRLKDNIQQHVTLKGTAFDLTSKEINAIKRDVLRAPTELYDINILEFLKNVADF